MSILKQMFTINSNGDQRAGMLYVPDDYNAKTDSCALLVFSHGTGESGDGTLNTVNSLFNNGSPLNVANNGNKMSFVSPYDGKIYKFIILGLQGIMNWCCQATENVYVIKNYVQKNYSINPNAIFKTGLSAGGEVTWEALAGPDSALFAGGVPMSTPPINGAISNISLIPTNEIKVWAFHGAQDGGITTVWNSINLCNQIGSTYSRLTQYPGGHCCWGTYYDPNYKESFSSLSGKSYNMYEIMLASMKGNNFNFSGTSSTTTSTTTKAPSLTTTTTTTKMSTTLQAVATATPAGNTVTLSGASSTGTIGSWWWDIVSKPVGAGNPTWDNGRTDGGAGLPSSIVKVGNKLADGTWVFRLNIQSPSGATSNSTVAVSIPTGTNPKTIIFQATMIDNKNLTVYNDYSYTLV